MAEILIIEDDPDTAEVLRGVVSGPDRVVIVVTSPAGLPPRRFDAILTDLLVVAAYESEAVRAWTGLLRERYPAARLVLVTGHAGAAEDGPERLGVDAVVGKPFDIGALEQLVASLLGGVGGRRGRDAAV